MPTYDDQSEHRMKNRNMIAVEGRAPAPIAIIPLPPQDMGPPNRNRDMLGVNSLDHPVGKPAPYPTYSAEGLEVYRPPESDWNAHHYPYNTSVVYAPWTARPSAYNLDVYAPYAKKRILNQYSMMTTGQVPAPDRGFISAPPGPRSVPPGLYFQAQVREPGGQIRTYIGAKAPTWREGFNKTLYDDVGNVPAPK